MSGNYLIGLTVLLWAAWMGCAGPEAQLTPAPSQLSEGGMPVNAAGGVELTTDPLWPGNPQVPGRVTPLKVIIRNRSGVPVYVRYSDFQISGASNRRYAALPPFDLQGTIAERAGPLFDQRRFYYSPHLRFLRPQWSDPYYEDEFYQGKYFGEWQAAGVPRAVELPTPEMLALALPAGVVEDGGEVTGFLYFQKIDPREGHVQLRYTMVNARTGRAFGTIGVPFVVARR